MIGVFDKTTETSYSTLEDTSCYISLNKNESDQNLIWFKTIINWFHNMNVTKGFCFWLLL